MTKLTEQDLDFTIETDELAQIEEKTIVIKISGKTVNGEHIDNILSQLVFLTAKNVKILLVHGAGPQLNKAFGNKRLDDQGERITPPDKMYIAQNIDRKISLDLIKKLQEQDGLNFEDIGFLGNEAIHARARSKENASGNIELDGFYNSLETKFGKLKKKIVVVGHTGIDELSGKKININADNVATDLAGLIKAYKLLILGTTNGVLDSNGDTISEIVGKTDFQALVNTGVINAGMYPKVNSAVNIAEKIKHPVHIMPEHHPSYPNQIIRELLTRSGAGKIATKVSA